MAFSLRYYESLRVFIGELTGMAAADEIAIRHAVASVAELT
jgi:hypothetical protein